MYSGFLIVLETSFPYDNKRSARMRTRRSGRWLLKQPRLGARMCQWHILSYIRKHCVTLKRESHDSYRAKTPPGDRTAAEWNDVGELQKRN